MAVFWCVVFFLFLLPLKNAEVFWWVFFSILTVCIRRCFCEVYCGMYSFFLLPVSFLAMFVIQCPQRTIRFGERWAVDE